MQRKKTPPSMQKCISCRWKSTPNRSGDSAEDAASPSGRNALLLVWGIAHCAAISFSKNVFWRALQADCTRIKTKLAKSVESRTAVSDAISRDRYCCVQIIVHHDLIDTLAVHMVA